MRHQYALAKTARHVLGRAGENAPAGLSFGVQRHATDGHFQIFQQRVVFRLLAPVAECEAAVDLGFLLVPRREVLAEFVRSSMRRVLSSAIATPADTNAVLGEIARPDLDAQRHPRLTCCQFFSPPRRSRSSIQARTRPRRT
jgi:hypothetical protein